MSVAAQIRAKLEAGLGPCTIEVADESARHKGHAGARPGGETHFRVAIVAEAFRGRSRIERQRLVNRILADELKGPVHALALTTLAPGE
jgi:BolA protein